MPETSRVLVPTPWLRRWLARKPQGIPQPSDYEDATLADWQQSLSREQWQVVKRRHYAYTAAERRREDAQRARDAASSWKALEELADERGTKRFFRAMAQFYPHEEKPLGLLAVLAYRGTETMNPALAELINFEIQKELSPDIEVCEQTYEEMKGGR